MSERITRKDSERILVVDDTPANLQLLTNLLKEQGYIVHPASDGKLALEFIQTTRPDLILLDIRMPGMDGYEVCRRFKADEKIRNVPVIFVTALGNERDKVEGFRVGAVDYITKPFQPEEVLARIRIHLRLRELTENLKQEVDERTKELVVTNQRLQQEIAERKRAEESLQRLNRELRAISKCNQTLMRSVDEQILLNSICQIICDDAGYRMAWVGYAENDEAGTIRPVAWAGAENGYLKEARITKAKMERGGGPSGTAIRSGESVCIHNFTKESKAVWRDRALQCGYRSGIALPLKDESGNTFGVLNIYSSEPDIFTPDEIRLLEELANDLAFGIVALRTRAERKLAESQKESAVEAMRQAKVQAEVANRYKTEFLTNISHDLRTPLNAILGFAYILKSVDMPEEYQKSVDFINESGKHLLELVESILDVSKMELGKTELKSKEFDFLKLLENSVAAARVELGEKDVKIFLSIEGKIPRLKGDTLRVKQIIDNLLSNAEKYTEQGEIKITVKPDDIQPDEKKYRVRVSVKDTGIGIPAEKLPYIFDPFSRFHEFYKGKTFEGTGLGLHIVQGLVRFMGGDIRVASEVGKGSEFIVTFNFGKAEI